MCFGGKGTGGNQGGNANAEDSAIRKQFSKEGKPAKEARAYFRDRDAGKFLNSTNYRQDELGNVKIDTTPTYFENLTIADVLDPEMYDASKVNANITFKERKESDLNNLSKRDVLQARSRYNKYGPGSSEAMKGNIKVTPWDMVDYAEDGTVQGIGMNKTMGTEFYPSGKAKGQLVLDPKAAIYGLPSFTDSGEFNPKYDKNRESFIGKGLTKFTEGLQENPLKIIPGVGTALTIFDMLKKGRSGGEGEEDVSTNSGALSSSVFNRPQKRPTVNIGALPTETYPTSNINRPILRPTGITASDVGEAKTPTFYDMFGDSKFQTTAERAKMSDVQPNSLFNRIDALKYFEDDKYTEDTRNMIDELYGSRIDQRNLSNEETGSPSRYVNYALNESGSDDNDSYSENDGVPIQPVIAPYADYAQWMPNSEYIGASSYGGPFSSASQNFASVLPPSIYSTGGSSNSVPTRFVNDRTKQYFTAPNDSYYAEENSDWRQANPYSLA